MRMLGLVGGVTWHSTIDYYRLINEGVNAKLGGSQSARLVLHSLNFGEIAELSARHDWDAVLDIIGPAAAHLKQSGAEALVLCANTMHVIADRLENQVGLPVIHIVDATAQAIRHAGLDRVTLLGTRYTMELDFFKDRLAWHGVTAVIPEAEDREFIHQSIFSELGKNVILEATRSRYLSIMDTLAEKSGSQGAILGCTEIPLLIKQNHASQPVFDTTALHSRAAVEFALG